MLKWLKNFFFKRIYKPPDTLDEKIEYLLSIDRFKINEIYLIKYPFIFSNVYRYNKELKYILDTNLLEENLVNSVKQNEIVRSFLYFLSEDDILPNDPDRLLKNFLFLIKEINIRYNMYKTFPNKLPLSYNLRILSLHIEHLDKIVNMLFKIHHTMEK